MRNAEASSNRTQIDDGGRDRRLIEEWLPIAALSEESIRERRSMTALPPVYYLHVWWARRPLVACRAAILGSLLPAGVSPAAFHRILGTNEEAVRAREAIDRARLEGERVANPYTWPRAFTVVPDEQDLALLQEYGARGRVVLDSTAGGGSIPFEAARLKSSVIANDLNPVAWLILRATVEFPIQLGSSVLKRYLRLASLWRERMQERVIKLYPPARRLTETDETYLWARTVTCPYCDGLVPLSPNWRLDGKGHGVRLMPAIASERRCQFEVVSNAKEHSAGTIAGGKGLCPYPDCGRVIDGDEIKDQARSGNLGEQLYAVVYTERRAVGLTKAGKTKYRKHRGFRAPRPEDDAAEAVAGALAAKMPEWHARGVVPDEAYPSNTNDDRPRQYGMPLWRDLFSPRQLYGHCTAVEVFRDLVDECSGGAAVSKLDQAALTYLALALDKLLNYNARLVRWHSKRGVVTGVFDRHDYAFLWSFAEMAPCIPGLGYDWAVKQTGKSLRELIDLTGGERYGRDASDQTVSFFESEGAPVQVTCRSADDLPHLADGSVDAVVLDPPYYDNVMYAELADFFYVWLKRTAGVLFPEAFASYLTDKDREAVANPAKFRDFSKVRGTGGAKRRASRDYQERMQAIFAEARRVLRPDGIMTLMFTHKATGAWDALAKGLVQAGFTITASWPIHTEAEGSLHIKDKNAAKSTILLVCRPRGSQTIESEQTYWEEVEPRVRAVVQERVGEFQAAGIGGVDLYLSCFGPALQVFSEHWPMIRGRANQRPPAVRGSQFKLIEEEEWDPYAVRPEDALMAARSAVKEWRLEQIATLKRKGHLDPVTEWYVLAWDAFQSPQFPADEALKLARVVGVSFDERLRGRILEVKSSNVILWDSSMRASKGALGSMKGEVMIDVLHHAARLARQRNTGVAKEALESEGLLAHADLHLALQALLEVLPPPSALPSSASGAIAGAGADAEALEALRRLVFARDVPAPRSWQRYLPGEVGEAARGAGE